MVTVRYCTYTDYKGGDIIYWKLLAALMKAIYELTRDGAYTYDALSDHEIRVKQIISNLYRELEDIYIP